MRVHVCTVIVEGGVQFVNVKFDRRWWGHVHTPTHTHTHTFVNTHIETGRHMRTDKVVYRHNANTKICPWGMNGGWRPECVSVFFWESLRMLPPRSEKVQFTSTVVSTSLTQIWLVASQYIFRSQNFKRQTLLSFSSGAYSSCSFELCPHFFPPELASSSRCLPGCLFI